MSPHPAAPGRRALRATLAATVAVLCSTLAPGAFAADTLTLDQALKLARTRSQALVAQDSVVSAARDMAVAARRLPDPVLTFGVNNLPVNGPDQWSLTNDFMTMRSIGVMQEFTRGGKRTARAARFEREADSAIAAKELAAAGIERDTALAWFDRRSSESIGALLARQRDESRLEIDAAEAAYRGGRGSQVDVLAARSAVALIDDRIAQNERQVRTAKTMLSRWVGPAAADPLGAAPTLTLRAPDDADLDSALGHHPAVTVLSAQEAMATADAEVARASRDQDWSVALMYNQRGPNYSNMISINVSVPLPWDQANRQDREVSAKLALADQARAQREEFVRAHVAEVRAMWEEWQGNRERLVRYDAAILPLAAERTRAALTAYRSGSGMLAAVLEARRNEIEMRIERVKLETETARVWAQLTFMTPSDAPSHTKNP